MKMRSLLLLAPALAAALTLAACGKSGKAPAAAASAAASAARVAAPTLLLAPEDLLTLQPSRLATGPVISGSVQPER
ncbi:MAG: hypothetical protein C0505_16640, partial [Leptothrix sp. (in: Bacteria)]|nr:hypothetical protein [Leptothrix sp. (in: b-proteobacteria)]